MSLARRLVALSLSLVMSSAGSFEIAMTAAERDGCAAEGGCQVVSDAYLSAIASQAYRFGRATCETRL